MIAARKDERDTSGDYTSAPAAASGVGKEVVGFEEGGLLTPAPSAGTSLQTLARDIASFVGTAYALGDVYESCNVGGIGSSIVSSIL